MNPKLIAFYFPQFHSIPENDHWWGTGFTDWELVKKAKANYNNHNQPRIPLDGYYDPTNPKTLSHQIEIAKNYGVYGFMFYHYWFDGKLLLEKPLEIFLEKKDLNFPFCLCWANETWTRAWSGHPEDILIEQTHTPDKELWKKHFNYLLPFLKDDRAIKINDMPVIVIYQPSLIHKGAEMIQLWRDLARQNGIDDIYVVAMKNHNNNATEVLKAYNAILKFQPREAYNSKEFSRYNKVSRYSFLRKMPETILSYMRKYYSKISSYQYYDSRILWDIILRHAYEKEQELEGLDVMESAYFEWDNTARYGTKAKIFSKLPDEELYNNLLMLYQKAQSHNSPFIFFNAWNEWSESAYLEPDSKYGYENLRLIYKVFGK